MENSWWGQELHPYDQYEEKILSNLENVFMQFMTYQASSKANQNSIQNLEIQGCKSYSMENCQWEQELQPYNQYEEERISKLDNLLMQLKESYESTQHTIKNLKIQFGKLEKEVTKFLVTREEHIVEVEAHEESLVEEHDSREKNEEKSEERTQEQLEKCSQVEIQQESILQVNITSHQLIVKEERHGE
ncbi:hypothetical protein HKD37_11G032336 [Glycine soja]